MGQNDSAAQRALKERRLKAPEQIDNSALHAGQPMYYYCTCCGAERILDELWIVAAPKLCEPCQKMKDDGLLSESDLSFTTREGTSNTAHPPPLVDPAKL